MSEQQTGRHEEYAARLPERLDELDRAWARYVQDLTDKAPLAEMHRLTHLLADPGETLYYQELAGIARRLEQLLLESLLGPEEALQHTFADHVQGMLDQMRQRSHQSRRMRKVPLEANPVAVDTGPTPAEETQTVFILIEDPDEAAALGEQLELFGYEARLLDRSVVLSAAIAEQAPAAIITGDARALATIKSTEGGPPVVFISSRRDIAARLEAVRAGGNAYLVSPIDVSVLIDKLDRLTGRKGDEPVRVLIIEDDQIMAEYYRLILGQSGMLSQLVLDPLQLLEQLDYFHPDLILMDLYMPGCDGLELAAVLRQQETYHDVPIVFLSREENIDRQMKALEQGAEGFLTKPVEPHHLITSIRNRVRRARILRSLVTTDSLTGLLNHSNLKRQLEQELSRSGRRHSPLALAMIDLDHFKQINDRHGHLLGDRVLRSVSMLLRQRVRPGDLVGRYGGEEFVVVLPHTDGPHAVERIDTLRRSVGQLRFRGPDAEFGVTFSAGIALVPPPRDPEALLAAADAALYQAKEAGRDRTVLSE